MRKKRKQHIPKYDYNFLKALDNMQPCSGIALGLDRILMLALDLKDIQKVQSFPFDRA